MSKPNDATLKALLETYPQDWLPLLGGTAVPGVEVINADVSTVTAAADTVLRVPGDAPALWHVEAQAQYDADLIDRMLQYNVLLTQRHKLPVRSAALLLHRAANSPSFTGVFERRIGTEAPYLAFRYQVVRVWELPVESILAGGLGTLPLAPLCDVARERIPDVIRQVENRVAAETTGDAAGELLTASYILTGLRFTPVVAKQWFEGVFAMKESSTYQWILTEGRAEGIRLGREEGLASGLAEGRTIGRAEGREEGRMEGRAEELRRLLLNLGRKRFGPPSASVLAQVEVMTDIARLEQLAERLLDVASWDELLSDGGPPTNGAH